MTTIGAAPFASDDPVVLGRAHLDAAAVGRAPGEAPAEGRRRRFVLRDRGRHLRLRDRGRVVEAADRRERLHRVVDVAARTAGGVAVGEPQQQGAVAVEGVLQGLGEVGPEALVVEGEGDAGRRGALGEHPVAEGRLEGLPVDLVEEVGDPGRARVGRVPEEAAAGVDAVLEIARQCGLEAGRLLEPELERVEREVDRAVEDEPPDLGGEEVGVRRAELGAVGRPEVVQLGVAERRAQDVHVARGLDRGDVSGQVSRPVGAAPPEGLVGGDVVVALGGGVGIRVAGEEGVEVVVAEAVDRTAAAGAARVEAHDVVDVEERRAEGGVGMGGVVGAGRAGPAGVDHERADPLGGVGRRDLEQCELDGVAGRVVVVERHGQRRAEVGRAALLPGQLLGVVRREGGARRGGGARLRGRGGCVQGRARSDPEPRATSAAVPPTASSIATTRSTTTSRFTCCAPPGRRARASSTPGRASAAR